jgi:hypothetical protein
VGASEAGRILPSSNAWDLRGSKRHHLDLGIIAIATVKIVKIPPSSSQNDQAAATRVCCHEVTLLLSLRVLRYVYLAGMVQARTMIASGSGVRQYVLLGDKMSQYIDPYAAFCTGTLPDLRLYRAGR